MTEHVFLVAVTVEAEDREAAERHLHTVLPAPGAEVESWWVAEDDRRDGSDCDSAVFVTPGQQTQALHVLLRAGLTAGHNVVTRGQ
jgi:hypothetical protein